MIMQLHKLSQCIPRQVETPSAIKEVQAALNEVRFCSFFVERSCRQRPCRDRRPHWAAQCRRLPSQLCQGRLLLALPSCRSSARLTPSECHKKEQQKRNEQQQRHLSGCLK